MFECGSRPLDGDRAERRTTCRGAEVRSHVWTWARTVPLHRLHNLSSTERGTAPPQTPHNFRSLLAFSPKQLLPQRFVHDLASLTGRNQPKQFISESIVDGHIEFAHPFTSNNALYDCQYDAPFICAESRLIEIGSGRTLQVVCSVSVNTGCPLTQGRRNQRQAADGRCVAQTSQCDACASSNHGQQVEPFASRNGLDLIRISVLWEGLQEGLWRIRSVVLLTSWRRR